MTLNEFITKLEKTPRTWRLMAPRRIRCMKGCPIQALGGAWDQRDGALGLAPGVKASIVTAADRGNNKLRARLLKACGL